MLWMFFRLWFLMLSGLFWLARRLRMGIPFLYALLVPTLFRGWYLAHIPLAEQIFYVLVGVSILSWVVSLVRKVLGLIRG